MKAFGKHPNNSKRIDQIRSSPYFINKSFHNVNLTSMYPAGGSALKTAWNFLTTKKPQNIKPKNIIPSVKTDLTSLQAVAPTVIWFGHSSYLIKYKDFNILVDPVYSGYASPIRAAVKAFPGTDAYSVGDLPKIDILLLTHDHYDHIDFETVVALKYVKRVICPLGVGEHLEHWGYPAQNITELDWWGTTDTAENIKVTATPARHFSGRGLTRNKTLWASFVLQLADFKIFIGGDSGYDDQFKKIGEKFNTFDLAILECGQYNENWPYIHMLPEETAQAAIDLNAKILMPVHWGKFILSVHPWTEPIERLLVKARELNLSIATPTIGEIFRLNEPTPQSDWWRHV